MTSCAGPSAFGFVVSSLTVLGILATGAALVGLAAVSMVRRRAGAGSALLCAVATVTLAPAFVFAIVGVWASVLVLVAQAIGWLTAAVFALRQQPLAPRADTPDLVERRRKTPHLWMMLHVPFILAGGHLLAVAAARVLAPGTVPAPAACDLSVARELTVLAQGPWLGAGLVGSFVALVCAVMLLTPGEILRILRPGMTYPYHRLIQGRLRSPESRLIGAHVHMVAGLAVGLGLSGFLLDGQGLAAGAAVAIICTTLVADFASAVVGRKWGRTMWPHNPDKSHAGTIGGAAVAVLCCMPFVGPLGALIGVVVFVFTDLAAPIPLRASDNLLTPILMAIGFAAFQDYLVAPLGVY